MMKHIIAVVLVTVAVILTAGCFGLSSHDEADKVYGTVGYYYLEDDNGRSFNKTLHEGDVSIISQLYSPNKWITYVQGMRYIHDGTGKDIFYNATETMIRGGGDCEDLAILMARGLHDMGFDTAVIALKGHAVVGISVAQTDAHYKGIQIPHTPRKDTYTNVTIDRYYVIEPTGGWTIGEYNANPVPYEKIYRL